MIQPEQLKPFFPPLLWDNQQHRKYIIKEYLQLLILDYLTTTTYINKIVFIGGTNLRLVKRIDRFSEDLDFDCKGITESEFIKMTDGIVEFLKRLGYRVETRDKKNDKLNAYQRTIYFPELLFELGLSGYRQERFLVKIESQDQQIEYKKIMAPIEGCGMYFLFPVPTDAVLCAMKISALLSRQKGRDFYDVMFLLAQTPPDYTFLEAKCGINNPKELKSALHEVMNSIDINHKAKDFEHLIFQSNNTNKIIHFEAFVESRL